MRRDDSRADCTAGRSRATRTPMMAITTNNSTSVNPLLELRENWRIYTTPYDARKRRRFAKSLTRRIMPMRAKRNLSPMRLEGWNGGETVQERANGGVPEWRTLDRAEG